MTSFLDVTAATAVFIQEIMISCVNVIVVRTLDCVLFSGPNVHIAIYHFDKSPKFLSL